MNGLEVRGLTKSFDDVIAVDDVSLSIQAGQVLGLLGRNGAGKSTLISCVAGLLRPDSGETWINGSSRPQNPLTYADSLGLIAQEIAIYPTLTVRENLQFFCELRYRRFSRHDQEIERLLEVFDLGQLRDRIAARMSTGQKRRLHTAAGLVGRPSCVLLDEPTAGADAQTRAHILEEVKRIAADGAAVIYTSHYTPEIEAVATNVAIMDGGRLLLCQSIGDLREQSDIGFVKVTFAPNTGGKKAMLKDSQTCTIPSATPGSSVTTILRDLERKGNSVSSIEIVEPSLESLYLDLTERHETSPGAHSGHLSIDLQASMTAELGPGRS